MGHYRSLALRAEVVEKEMEPDSKVAGSLFPFSDEAIEYSYSFYYS